MEDVTPGDEGCVVDRVDDWTFKVGHHFHVVVIFHVVGFDDGLFAVYDHEFCVKSS